MDSELQCAAKLNPSICGIATFSSFDFVEFLKKNLIARLKRKARLCQQRRSLREVPEDSSERLWFLKPANSHNCRSFHIRKVTSITQWSTGRILFSCLLHAGCVCGPVGEVGGRDQRGAGEATRPTRVVMRTVSGQKRNASHDDSCAMKLSPKHEFVTSILFDDVLCQVNHTPRTYHTHTHTPKHHAHTQSHTQTPHTHAHTDRETDTRTRTAHAHTHTHTNTLKQTKFPRRSSRNLRHTMHQGNLRDLKGRVRFETAR